MPIHNILECINNFPVVLFDFFIFGIYGIKTHETIYDMFCDDAFVIFCIFVSAYYQISTRFLIKKTGIEIINGNLTNNSNFVFTDKLRTPRCHSSHKALITNLIDRAFFVFER